MAELSVAARREKIKAVVRVASGNFLEMFDFMIFGYYAAAIGRTFFPKSSEIATLMSALASFGAGFLMRPLGAVALGAYVDRHGRRKGLILTLGLMAIGTLSIAVTPGYASIGMLAPALVVAGRLIQGFSAGVELGGVSVYLAEIATPGNKGFYVSWQSASQQMAVMQAALSGVLLHSFLSGAEIDEWGWRLPLIGGCLIVPILFVIRSSLRETDEFEARQHRPSVREVLGSLATNWELILAGTAMVTMTTVAFYFITAYTPTFGRSVLKLGEKDTLIVTVFVGVSNFLWLPTMGAVSDRIGRRTLMIASTAVTILTAYPAMLWLAGSPSFARLLAVEFWLSFLYGSYNGAMIVYLTEIMPPAVRASGFSLAYSLATALFGGFTPLLATYLIELTGNKAVPGAWLSLAAGIGLAATLWSGSLAARGVGEKTTSAGGWIASLAREHLR